MIRTDKDRAEIPAALPPTRHHFRHTSLERRTLMNRMPLPLELTQPVLLAGDLNSQLRDALAGDYDARTQLCSGTSSSVRSATLNMLGIQVDVNADVNVDDVIA
jgi:hypothetical protein